MELLYAENQARITIIRLEPEYGSLDYQKLWELEEKLIAELNSAADGVLVICDTTRHAGCGFVNVLKRCHQRARPFSKRLGICGMNPQLSEIFILSRLELEWKIYETRQEAIEAMQTKLDDGMVITDRSV